MYNSRCQGHRGVALLCTTGQCRFEMIRIERNRFNECRQRFRSMLVCKVLARIQDHLQNAEQALYRLRANSIVQICAVCIFTISIHLLILLASLEYAGRQRATTALGMSGARTSAIDASCLPLPHRSMF